jgi:hypothetical protein
MLQARPHAIHFKRILDFGEGHPELPDALLLNFVEDLILDGSINVPFAGHA